MISTLRLERKMILKVTVEHPDAWNTRKIRRAAENAGIFSEVDWQPSVAEAEDKILRVVVDEEDPDDERQDPIPLSDVDLLGDSCHEKITEDDEGGDEDLPTSSSGFEDLGLVDDED